MSGINEPVKVMDEDGKELCTVIRARRKKMSLVVAGNGVFVIVPFRTPEEKVQAYVTKNAARIKKKKSELDEKKALRDSIQKLSAGELEEITDRALEYIPKRVAYYAPLVGVTYGTVYIGIYKSVWGRCSSNGNLSFNALLMLSPPEVIDAIVVHELCHRKEMNHSKRFYREVYGVYPDYDKWNKWLKEKGWMLLKKGCG